MHSASAAGYPRVKICREPGAGTSRGPGWVPGVRDGHPLHASIERIESHDPVGGPAGTPIAPAGPTRGRYRSERNDAPWHRSMRRSPSGRCPPSGTRIHTPGASRCMYRQPGSAWLHLRPGLGDLTEHRDIDLGVDLCRQNGAMPKSRSDVLQRSALPQKRRGDGMAQEMRSNSARRCDTSAPHRPSDNDGDGCMGSEGAKRCATTNEHAIAVRRRSADLQICNEGVTHFLSEAESRLPLSLPDHLQPCALPVDVTKTQLDDIPGAKSKTREQEENRAVPFADGSGGITGCDDAFDFFRLKVSRQR